MISAASALDERERQRRGALPNISVNALVIDNQLSDTVYVATDIGVFSDAGGGANWEPFKQVTPPIYH